MVVCQAHGSGCGMGNLLRVLYNKENTAPDIFVDFEKCEPTAREEQVHASVQAVLDQSPAIVATLRDYKGAANEIREAISHPDDKAGQDRAWDAVSPLVSQLKVFYVYSQSLGKYLNVCTHAISHPDDKAGQDRAWDAVSPLVSQLKVFYVYSQSLEDIVPQLLEVLCSNDMTPKEHLETQQALFKQFAQILDFVLTFDDLKMTNPAIQNDFSYYRRTLSRIRMSSDSDVEEDLQLDVSSEMANKMSLFYALSTPMMHMLSKTTTKFVSENKELPVENTTECLSTMAGICRTMIENEEYRNKFESEDTVMFCLRVMVGVIILYDHVHPVGAFAKSSSIDMKSSIKVLKEQPAGRVEGLLNALRYTSKHLNDETTPKAIKSLLA